MASLAEKIAAAGGALGAAIGTMSQAIGLGDPSNRGANRLASLLTLGGPSLNPFFQLDLRNFSVVTGGIPDGEDFASQDFAGQVESVFDLPSGSINAEDLPQLLGTLRQLYPEEFTTLVGGLTDASPGEIQGWINQSARDLALDILGVDSMPRYGTPEFGEFYVEYGAILRGETTEQSTVYIAERKEQVAREYFEELGYDPTPEELEEVLSGGDYPTRESIGAYVDPRQVTTDEVIERLERLGVDVEAQAEAAGQTPEEYAEQIKESMPPGDGSEAAFDESMIMSLTSTAASGGFKESITKLATGVRNILFGTGPGGRPKTWLEILEEQIERKYFPENQLPGFPLEIVFDPSGVATASNPTGATVRANVKIPVPLPVNGPPIVIPIFDENGNYVGPSTPSETAALVIDPETGIIAQVVEGVSQTVAQIKGEALQILGAAGDVVRSFPLWMLENPDWKEGDPNPFEIEVDENGDIAPQVDENGTAATGFDPETGLPVYEQLDEENEEGSQTRSPYDEGAEAADEFYGNFPEGTDPNDYVTQQQLADAIDALDIPEDTVRTDEEIKDLAQGIIDELDLPEDTQISDEDLASAIGTYLTDNGYITEDTTRSDEDINTLIGEALTDYATVEGVQDTLDTYFGEDGSVTRTLTALGFDTDEIKDIIGTPSNYEDPETGEVTEEATGMYALVEGAATPQDIIDAVGVPTTNESGEVIGGTGIYGDLFSLGVDIENIEDAIGSADDSSGLYGYIDAAVEDLATTEDVERIVGVPDIDEETGELTDKSTGLYLEFYEAGLDYNDVVELIGVPDDPSTPDVDEGRGLFGYVGQSSQNVQDYIDTVLGDVPGQITSISGFLGTPGAEVDDPDTEIDETLPTGLFATIEANRAAGETERDAIIKAINTFTSDGQYTIEQVLTAISDSNTDLKDFIGSPGADVDDPNTDVDETLPTGIYAGIAGSESTILDAISESEDNTDEYLTYISNIIGVPVSEITQEDVDGIVGLLGEEEAITDINNDIRLYDANFDGVINDVDIGLLQGFVDAGVEGVGEIPATGLYADAAQRQLELQGYIDDSAEVTQGLISSEAADTRQLVGQTALFNAMMSAGDAGGRRVDVSTPDPARINYIYDFSDVFATPQQKGLFPSPYGGPQRAQQQQIAQKRGIMSGPLQIGGMAQGGKVDYDFTDEIMQIMSYGDNQ